MSEAKIDKILEKIHSIDITLARNTASLELHMKRTDLLEKKLEPVEAHVSLINASFKVFGAVGAVVGIIATLYKLWQP
jgi:flagellar motor component MotA